MGSFIVMKWLQLLPLWEEAKRTISLNFILKLWRQAIAEFVLAARRDVSASETLFTVLQT